MCHLSYPLPEEESVQNQHCSLIVLFTTFVFSGCIGHCPPPTASQLVAPWSQDDEQDVQYVIDSGTTFRIILRDGTSCEREKHGTVIQYRPTLKQPTCIVRTDVVILVFRDAMDQLSHTRFVRFHTPHE